MYIIDAFLAVMSSAYKGKKQGTISYKSEIIITRKIYKNNQIR